MRLVTVMLIGGGMCGWTAATTFNKATRLNGLLAPWATDSVPQHSPEQRGHINSVRSLLLVGCPLVGMHRKSSMNDLLFTGWSEPHIKHLLWKQAVAVTTCLAFLYKNI